MLAAVSGFGAAAVGQDRRCSNSWLLQCDHAMACSALATEQPIFPCNPSTALQVLLTGTGTAKASMWLWGSCG